MYTYAMPSSQLIPPPELAPPSTAHLSVQDRMRLWAQMVDEGDQFLLARFRQKCASDLLARQAFLAWLEHQDAERTAVKARMLRGRRRGPSDGQ